jgi:hypothetical protein
MREIMHRPKNPKRPEIEPDYNLGLLPGGEAPSAGLCTIEDLETVLEDMAWIVEAPAAEITLTAANASWSYRNSNQVKFKRVVF